MPEISEELRARFKAHAGEPGHIEAVLVTLHSEADAKQLEEAGMDVEHRMRNRPIMAGKINSATLSALSAMDGIVRIEPDSSMHALGD